MRRGRVNAFCRVVAVVGSLSMAAALPVVAQNAPALDDRALSAARAAAEWLVHGGDYAETRYSSLTEITRQNVERLGLAWSVELGSAGARLEGTPLVSNGVLYTPTTWNVIYAIDLRTKAIKWRWDPGVPRGVANGGPRACCGPVSRGIALYGGRVYAATFDGRLAALDAETGRVAWVVQTTQGQNYSITGAPRIVKGKVLIGNGGGDMGVRGYVTAYDAATGKQAWRFYTTPGDPSAPFENPALERAAATWSGEWWKVSGGGGTVWDAMAYDPEADLLYVGTGNGGPWNRETRSPGGGDNLYLASILALRPDTGELIWHYQTTPGEAWDFTAVQNMVLADLTIDGQPRKVLMQAPKNGFFYVLDRLTGELISAQPFARVNWASGIDKATGRPIEAPQARYADGAVEIFPGPRGAHNWHPMSWSPATGLMYIPGQENSFVFRSDPSSSLGVVFGRGGGPALQPPVVPPSIGAHAPVGEPGFLVAWDPVMQTERWRVHFPTRENSGTLATAGRLVFHGSARGLFAAHDAETGAVLWQVQLYPGIASPVSYELDGRQYVAVLAGPQSDNPPGRLFVFAIDGTATIPATTSP